jgi:hypothetical protein
MGQWSYIGISMTKSTDASKVWWFDDYLNTEVWSEFILRMHQKMFRRQLKKRATG